MHIIQVTPRFPPAIGGVEEHVFRISKELAKRGHSVIIVTSDEADGRQITLRAENIGGLQIYRYPLFVPSIFRESWFIPQISKILSKLRADIVHAHGYRCLSSFQAASTAHFRHIPSVLTPHGIYPPRSFLNGLAKVTFDKSFGRLMFSFFDRIITLSRHNERLLSQLGASSRKMITVPNGADIEEFLNLHRSTRVLEELQTNGPILLYVGRIDWNKQVGKIVEAMPTILMDFPSARLVIVGPDYANYTPQLHDLGKKLMVEDSLVMTHDVPRRTLLEYYSVADAFILPSSYEGFGLSMLEAMCSGIPVIASPVGGPGDILKDRTNALLLKEISPAEISKQVRIILTNRSLKEEIVKNARELVETTYTWKKVVDQLEEIYTQTITEGERKFSPRHPALKAYSNKL